MIQITLNNVGVNVGHGTAPDGERLTQVQFVDPQSGIVVGVTFVGTHIDSFRDQLKPPSGIDIVQALPEGLK